MIIYYKYHFYFWLAHATTHSVIHSLSQSFILYPNIDPLNGFEPTDDCVAELNKWTRKWLHTGFCFWPKKPNCNTEQQTIRLVGWFVVKTIYSLTEKLKKNIQNKNETEIKTL